MPKKARGTEEMGISLVVAAVVVAIHLDCNHRVRLSVRLSVRNIISLWVVLCVGVSVTVLW